MLILNILSVCLLGCLGAIMSQPPSHINEERLSVFFYVVAGVQFVNMMIIEHNRG
jgi:hypothetical protein